MILPTPSIGSGQGIELISSPDSISSCHHAHSATRAKCVNWWIYLNIFGMVALYQSFGCPVHSITSQKSHDWFDNELVQCCVV